MTAEAFLAFAGARAHSGSLTIPSSGAWVADLAFAGDGALPTTGTLTCGDLSLAGAIYRERAFAGQRQARIVGGFGGWFKQLPSRSYYLPGGVKLSLVLGSTAHDAGERMAVTSDRVVGDHFVRQAGEGQRVLRQLVGEQWYVDTDGTTRTGQRTGKAVAGDFLINAFDAATGTVTISTESYAEWMPGNTFQNALVTDPQTISTVRIDVDNDGKLRHTVLVRGAEADGERLTASVRQIVRAEIASLGLFGVYRYSVIEASSDSVTCQPVNPTLPLPAIVSVPLRNGVAGMSATPAEGDEVALAFLDGSTAQPRIVGGHPPAGTTRPVVCYGDTVNVGAGDVLLSPGTVEVIELAAVGVLVGAERLTP